MSIFIDTAETLKSAAAKSSSVLVSYSGGKDSLACLDLVSRAGFKKIVCFYMYEVPGLQVIADRMKWARDTYNVETIEVPHWLMYRNIADQVYCDVKYTLNDLPPQVSIFEIYTYVMQLTDIHLVVNGGKTSDGIWRRRFLNNSSARRTHVCTPIKDWSKWDVISYLNMRKIPIPPESLSGLSAGIGVYNQCIVWLHDNHHDDYLRMRRIYPYVEAVIKRREFYGIGAPKGRAQRSGFAVSKVQSGAGTQEPA